MKASRRAAAGSVLIVLVVGSALLVPRLGLAPFDDPGEGMHAEIAREMLVTGDWVTPRLNGVRYFDKPPLLYWLTAASMRLGGPVEWTARVGPLLGALAALAATTLLGVRLLSPFGGALAGLALLTCPGFFAYACYARPETLFVAAMHGGLALLLVAPASSRWIALLGYAALGGAAVAKDLLGSVAPLVAVAIARALSRDGPRRRTLWIPGLAVLVVVAGAWYAAVEARHPGFLWYTIVDNHLLNAARARHFPDEDVPLGAAEFAAVAALGAFPWVLPAAATALGLVRGGAWRDPRETPWIALAVWAAGVLLVFTVSPFKLPHYGLPAYPALALLAARWWTTAHERHGRALHVALFALIALTMTAVAVSDGRAFLARVLQATDVYTRKETAIGETPPFPSWESLQPFVVGTAVVFAAGTIALGVVIARGAPARVTPSPGAVVTALTLVLWMPMVGGALARVTESRSVRDLAHEVARRARPGDLVIHEGPIENSGALELYGGRRPVILEGRTSVLGFGATFPDAAETFWERPRLVAAWRGGPRVFLVTIREPARSVVAGLPPSEVVLLAAGGGRRLYSNRD